MIKGLQMENTQIFTEYFFFRLLINLVSMIILIRFVYYNTYKKKDSFFTFFLLNIIVFILSYILEKSHNITLSSAFGILAAFTLLRIRTETLSMKEMTYLFIVMTIALINAIMDGAYFEIILLNVIIIVAVFIVDGNILIRNQQHQTIEYPSIEHIRPEHHQLLIEDLKKFTGLDIQKITIEHIDVGKQRATIRIYFY